MRAAGRVAVSVAVAGAAAVLYALAVPHFEAREQRAAGERQVRLIAAIRANDLAAVQDIVRRPVDVYATDETGESALSLAEKSGDPQLLAELAPRRDRAADLARAQRAAEFGYAIGLRSPRSEPDFDIAAIVRADASRARSEGLPPLSPEALADVIERDIGALPEGSRKQWALRNFANHLAGVGLLRRAQDTAVRLDDPTMRGETLIYLVQLAPRGDEVGRSVELARHEIDAIPDPTIRDPLYAQLAHFADVRGHTGPARDTCRAIAAPEYRTGVCDPDAKPDAEPRSTSR